MSTEERARFLPFALPDIGEEEITEVVECLRSGWITTGPRAREFERRFAEFIGGGVQAISVNSATAGLHLALEALGVAAGDVVATTPYTFTATAEVARYLGADVLFVDIEADSLNIDAAQLRAALEREPRTKAIVPVHIGGRACDMDAIRAIAARHGVPVLEDAAHALPATHHGRMIGTLSEATVFSFYATKTLATGEGGMLVSADAKLAERARIMRLHGISRDVFDRYTSRTPEWYYEVIAPGFKYNMPDIMAAIGIHQLRKVQKFRARRESIAQRYTAAFADLPVRTPPGAAAPGDLHAWHLYVLRLDEEHLRIGRDRFIEELSALGIGASVHFIPLHLQPYWRDRYALRPESYPEALAAYRSALSLPIYTRMTDDDVARVIEAVRTIVMRHTR
jgi:dTDP-4-amino-4,6-dideoxygalactose transaminase